MERDFRMDARLQRSQQDEAPLAILGEPGKPVVKSEPVKVTPAPKTSKPEEKPVRGAELTARARLEQLFDPGTFTEIDAQVHHRARHFGMEDRNIPGDGVICGFGEINGKTVYAFSQDRKVLGGSLGEAH